MLLISLMVAVSILALVIILSLLVENSGSMHNIVIDTKGLVNQSLNDTEKESEEIAEVLGIDWSEFKEPLDETDIKDICKHPPVGGKCNNGLVKNENGCCALKSTEVTALDQALAIGVPVGQTIAISLAQSLILFLLKERATKQAAIWAAKLKAKGVAKTMGKFAVKMGLKMAAFGARAIAKLASVVGSVTLIFDVMSLLIDFLDTSGYNNFTSNEINENAMRIGGVTMESLYANNESYPRTFDLQSAFTREFETVVNDALMALFGPRAFEIFGEMHGDEIANAFLEDLDDIPDVVSEAFISIFLNVTNSKDVHEFEGRKQPHYHTRDDIIYSALYNALVEEGRGREIEIERCPWMSEPDRYGVSFSKEGVKKWNNTHKPEWFRYNDLFEEVQVPDDYQAPLAAIWTTRYAVLDTNNPGTAEKPNIIYKEIKDDAGNVRPTAIMLPVGHVFSYCEKERNAKNMFGQSGGLRSITPTKFGVKMDDGTHDLMCTREEIANTDPTGGAKNKSVRHCKPRAICMYSENFCTRLGMKHQYKHAQGISDCIIDAGQEVGEFIAGTTIIRDAYKDAHKAFGYVCDGTNGSDLPCHPTQYCESKKCHPKKKTVRDYVAEGHSESKAKELADVGPNNSWKCLSGLEAYQKCVECRDGRNGQHHCDGKGPPTIRSDCTKKGSCFCQDDSSIDHDTCQPLKLTVKEYQSKGLTLSKARENAEVGLTAWYKCQSRKEAHSTCVECKHGSNKDCDDLRKPDGSKKYLTGTRYCENHGDNNDYCVLKKPDGTHVGAFNARKCKSGVECGMICRQPGQIPNKEGAGHCGANYCKSGKKKGFHCMECDRDSDCGAGRYCADWAGAEFRRDCRFKLVDGSRCGHDGQCKSGKCHWGRCAGKYRDCNLFKCCPGGQTCHHNWCIQGRFGFQC